MTVPGSNVLRLALSVLGRQTVVLYRYAARTTNATGRDVTVYAAPAVVTEGSVQAVPRTRYASMGLDLTRSYVTWFTTASVRGIERDRAPDAFLFGGRRYDVTAVTPWNLQDGWNEVLGVDVGPSSEIPNVGISWNDLEDIPANIQSLAALIGTGIIARINSGDLETVQGLVHVEGLEDLPEPVEGVIPLAANVTYMFLGTVDLGGLRLLAGANTAILGGSSENSRIRSTGLGAGVPLITSEWSLPMRGVTIEAPLALDLDAGANPGQALDWFGVNFLGCDAVGRIANYSNFIATDCALLDSAEMVFDGEFGTVGFSSCLLSGLPGEATLRFPATFTATRRVRAIYSAFVTPTGGTAVYVDPAAVIPAESYILDTVNLSGPGTATGGVQYTDNRTLFTNCKGVTNTNVIAAYSMAGNAVATTFVGVGVPAKVAGVTVPAEINQKFDHTNNRLTHTGAFVRDVITTSVLSVTSSAPNQQIAYYVAKNGVPDLSSAIIVTTNSASRAESVALQWPDSVGPNEHIEIWTANLSATTQATTTHLNTIVRSIS